MYCQNSVEHSADSLVPPYGALMIRTVVLRAVALSRVNKEEIYILAIVSNRQSTAPNAFLHDYSRLSVRLSVCLSHFEILASGAWAHTWLW